MNFLFGIVLPFVFFGCWIVACLGFWKQKHCELLFMIWLMVTVFLAGWIYARAWTALYEAGRNMEASFIKSASMIKDGKQQLLQQRISALLATKEFESSSSYRVSLAFRKAVEDLYPHDNNALTRAGLYGGMAGIAVGLLLLLVLGILYLLKLKTERRKAYLVIITGLASLSVLIVSAQIGVKNGYRVTGFHYDIRTLALELEKSDFSPALLKLMEEPKDEFYSFFRDLHVIEEKMDIKRQ